MKQTATRAVTYSRNSSKKQKSIDNQRDENRAACRQHAWTVVDELDDPVSASRYSTRVRKNWQRLLELLPDVDVIVLWEPSRGDRSLASWAAFLDECQEHQVRIHAVSHQRTYDPANPRDYRSLAEDGVDSSYESDKISQRTRRGKADAARKGRPNGILTFGYARRYDPATRQLAGQYEDPERAAVVRDLFAAVGAGESISGICKRLNRAGVPTPRGKMWYASSVKAITRNAAYRPHPDDPTRGCRVHNGDIHVAIWPPLVTEAAWQHAQKVIGTKDPAVRKRRQTDRPGQARYLLSGAARVMTAPCSGVLLAHKAYGHRSAHYICHADGCVAAPMAEMDEYVTRLVVARMSDKKVRDFWYPKDVAARKAARDELARLEAEWEEWRQSNLTPGGVSAVAFADKEAVMLPAIEDARRRAEPVGVPPALKKLLDAGKFGKQRVRPVWDNDLTLASKRQVITILFASLVLGPVTTRITRWLTPGERLDIVANRISHQWRTP